MRNQRRIILVGIFALAFLPGLLAQARIVLPSGFPCSFRVERNFLSNPLLGRLINSLGASGGFSLADIEARLEEHPALFSGVRELALGFNMDDSSSVKNFVGVLVLDYQAGPALAKESQALSANDASRDLRILDLGGEEVYAYAEGREVFFGTDKGFLEIFRATGERAEFPGLEPASFSLDIAVPRTGQAAVLLNEGIVRIAMQGQARGGESLELGMGLVFEDEALVEPWYHMMAGACLLLQGLGELPENYHGMLSQALPGNSRAFLGFFGDLRVSQGPGRVDVSMDLDEERLGALLGQKSP